MQVFRRCRTQPGLARPQAVSGFTMVELAVTMAVLAILIGISVPLFAGVINANRLTGNANEIVAALQIARSEAIRRNVRTIVCESDNGTSCANTTPWQGWLIYTDANGNNVADAGEVYRSGTIEQPVRVTTSSNIVNNRIVFRPDGIAYNGNALLVANIRVCLPITNPPINFRDVSIVAGGRVGIRANTVGAAGACPLPGN